MKSILHHFPSTAYCEIFRTKKKKNPALFLFYGIKPNFVNSVNAYSGSEEFVVFNVDLCSEQEVQSFWLHYAKFQEFLGMRERYILSGIWQYYLI